MSIICVLTGGLGNQLFQAAAALNLAGNKHDGVLFETSIGQPRRNQEGIVELFDYLSFKPEELHLKKNNIFKKVYRLNLIISTRQPTYLNLILKNMISIFSSLIASIVARKFLFVYTANGIGFDVKDKINYLKKNRLLIGYFQSYLYFEISAVRRMYQLKNKSAALAVAEIAEDLNIRQKVVIHVRRGDYLKEAKFGLLSLGYYAKAIAYFKSIGFQDFLVFSDDIVGAKNILDNLNEGNLEYFKKNDISSSELIELMTYAGGYVIANSTFSWWAGFLRKNESAVVCAPHKWFVGQKDPNFLLPKEWIRILDRTNFS